MRVISLILLNLIFSVSYGQAFSNDSILKEYTERLNQQGVDTVLIYERSCVGCIDMLILENDSCDILMGDPQISYILWRKKGQDFISKISNYNCYDYEIVSSNFSAMWNIYFANKIKIRKEKILIPSYVENKDTLYVDVDHYSYSHIRILSRKECFDFEISDYHLSEYIYDNIKNMNYLSNSHTLRKKLMDMVEIEIKNIEGNKLI